MTVPLLLPLRPALTVRLQSQMGSHTRCAYTAQILKMYRDFWVPLWLVAGRLAYLQPGNGLIWRADTDI